MGLCKLQTLNTKCLQLGLKQTSIQSVIHPLTEQISIKHQPLSRHRSEYRGHSKEQNHQTLQPGKGDEQHIWNNPVDNVMLDGGISYEGG